MLVDLKGAAIAVEDLVLALRDYVLFQLAERLCGSTAAAEWTSDYHVTFALFHVGESVLQLEYLLAVAAFYANLVDDVIQVSVWLFWVELAFALTAFWAALVQPLIDAISMENLLAIAALNWLAEWDTQADWTNERVNESAVLLLYILLT